MRFPRPLYQIDAPLPPVHAHTVKERNRKVFKKTISSQERYRRYRRSTMAESNPGGTGTHQPSQDPAVHNSGEQVLIGGNGNGNGNESETNVTGSDINSGNSTSNSNSNSNSTDEPSGIGIVHGTVNLHDVPFAPQHYG